MEFKGTQGPWSVLDIDMHDHVFTTAKPHRRICGVYGGIKGDEENQANARLIAAAPDLLEACLAFLARYDNHMVAADLLFSDVADTARAAIAKALGESS